MHHAVAQDQKECVKWAAQQTHIILLQAPRQWCLLLTFGPESSALFEKFDYLSKIYAMPRFQ